MDKTQINEVDKRYFLDEVRDGFFLPSFLKKAMAVGVKDYQVLDEICGKLGFRASATFGTLIGAIRNSGYIPWDDDIDTEIIHECYERLVKYESENGLPGTYHLADYMSFASTNLVRKLYDEYVVQRNEDGLRENYGFPFPNNIDIFIMDYIPQDEEAEQYYNDVVSVIGYARDLWEEKKLVMSGQMDASEFDEEAFTYNLGLVERVLQIKFDMDSDVDLSKQLWRAMDDFCLRFSSSQCDRLACLPYWIPNESRCFSKEMYADYIEVPFEFGTMKVPIGYDGILRTVFGNYCYPVLEFSAHEYPFYKAFERELEVRFGTKLNRYQFDETRVWDDMMSRGQDISGEVEGDAGKAAGIADVEFRNNKKEVVFIVDMVERWKSLHTLWEAVSADENTDVYVIPVPYAIKNYDGSINDDAVVVDMDGYPDGVEITEFDKYDMIGRHPDVIIYQNPYDEYSDVMTVLPEYYASEMFRHTDCMVFVPYFNLREIEEADERSKYTLSCYLANPGAVYADRIYAQSEQMKDRYVELLRKMDGGSELPDWESTVHATGLPISDWESQGRVLLRARVKTIDDIERVDSSKNATDEELTIGSGEYCLYDKSGKETTETIYDEVVDIPEQWVNILRREDDSFKKVLLSFISASVVLQYGVEYVDKILHSVDPIGKRRDDIVLFVVTDPNARYILRKHNPSGWSAYQKMIEKLKNTEYVVLIENLSEGNIADTLIKISDGYYGDGCKLLNDCRIARKPVLLETPTVQVTAYTDIGEKSDSQEEYLKWTPDILVATEGEWTVENFVSEVIAYQADAEITEYGRAVWEDIRGSIFDS